MTKRRFYSPSCLDFLIRHQTKRKLLTICCRCLARNRDFYCFLLDVSDETAKMYLNNILCGCLTPFAHFHFSVCRGLARNAHCCLVFAGCLQRNFRLANLTGGGLPQKIKCYRISTDVSHEMAKSAFRDRSKLCKLHCDSKHEIIYETIVIPKHDG